MTLTNRDDVTLIRSGPQRCGIVTVLAEPGSRLDDARVFRDAHVSQAKRLIRHAARTGAA